MPGTYAWLTALLPGSGLAAGGGASGAPITAAPLQSAVATISLQPSTPSNAAAASIAVLPTAAVEPGGMPPPPPPGMSPAVRASRIDLSIMKGLFFKKHRSRKGGAYRYLTLTTGSITYFESEKEFLEK